MFHVKHHSSNTDSLPWSSLRINTPTDAKSMRLFYYPLSPTSQPVHKYVSYRVFHVYCFTLIVSRETRFKTHTIYDLSFFQTWYAYGTISKLTGYITDTVSRETFLGSRLQSSLLSCTPPYHPAVFIIAMQSFLSPCDLPLSSVTIRMFHVKQNARNSPVQSEVAIA